MNTPHRHEGSCHCGNLEFVFDASAPLERLGLRADQCSFCRAHAARNTSDSGGGRYFQYWPSGQVSSDQHNATNDYQFGYYGYGHLTNASLNGSSLATYTWNGLDQRAIKAAATTTDYVYDRAGHMIAEANDATGAMIREYIWMDDKPVAMVDDTGASPVVYDIHTDHLGRPQKVTDQSGNLDWDGVFDPFGNPSGITGSLTMLLGFPGQYWDSETQLAQNWHRDYDPSIGRYIESDPIGLWGGVNTYAYIADDPEGYIDPTGLSGSCGPRCTTKKLFVTSYNDHGPGSDWPYYKNHPEGAGPGTVAVANSSPQPYPYGTTFNVLNPNGSSAYVGTARDTGAGWNRDGRNLNPDQWIDIWLPGSKAWQWGAQWRDVLICYQN